MNPLARPSPVVLIVDDDPLIRGMLVGVLDGHGFTTAEATTVATAKAATDQQPLAAVVLALTLEHDESGLAFLAWLRAHPDYGRTPVLILTGRPALEAGDQDLIQRYRAYVFYKPVSMTVLVEFLKSLTAAASS
jgi:DNA-binding response OmpR family regulator